MGVNEARGNGEMIGVGLVGIGGYGRSHLSSIQGCAELGICGLKAVTVRPQDAEPEFEAELESKGVVVYRDFNEMLAGESSNISLIAIPTSIASHRPLSVAALEAGYHVVCEKPASGTLADVDAMKQAAEKNNRKLAIGFQYLYSESVQLLKQARIENRFGKLVSAKGLALWPRTTAYYGRNEWSGKIESAGTLIYDSPIQNAVSHYLELMLYIAGGTAGTAARAATLYGENYRAKHIESADTQFVRIGTDTDVEISFWCSHAVEENHDIRIVFEFENGAIEFTGGGETNSFVLVQDGERTRFGVDEPPEDMRRRVFSDCVEAIREDRSPISSIDVARCHTEIVETLFTRVAPVAAIDDEYVDTIVTQSGEGPAGENRIIRGLDDFAHSCFTDGKSFAEAGAPWGRRGASIEV